MQCKARICVALTLYQTYSKLDTEFTSKFQSMELHKGVGQQVVKCFEAANVAGIENVCKKLQKSVTELESKIANLSLSNNSLQMDIDNASESLTNSSQIRPAPVAPCPGTTMSIIDELADRDRRKRNVIVYNLPESSGSSNKSDLQPCVHPCIIPHLLLPNQYAWERKPLISIDLYCYVFRKKKINLNFCPDLFCYSVVSPIRMYTWLQTEPSLKGKSIRNY